MSSAFELKSALLKTAIWTYYCGQTYESRSLNLLSNKKPFPSPLPPKKKYVDLGFKKHSNLERDCLRGTGHSIYVNLLGQEDGSSHWVNHKVALICNNTAHTNLYNWFLTTPFLQIYRVRLFQPLIEVTGRKVETFCIERSIQTNVLFRSVLYS